MKHPVKFCGECGTDFKADERFCGNCGWKRKMAKQANASPPKAPDLAPDQPAKPAKPQPPKDIKPEIIAPPPVRKAVVQPTVKIQSNLESGLRWAFVWLIGWLPAGLLIGLFWIRFWDYYGEIYDLGSLSTPWNRSLSVALIVLPVFGAIGGFLAGVILNKTAPQATKTSKVGMISIMLLWLVGWAVSLGPACLTNIYSNHLSDDPLLIIGLITAPILAVISAQIALSKAGHGTDLPIRIKSRAIVSIGWAFSAVISFLLALIIIGA